VRKEKERERMRQQREGEKSVVKPEGKEGGGRVRISAGREQWGESGSFCVRGFRCELQEANERLSQP
jgi:hypothetical protein